MKFPRLQSLIEAKKEAKKFAFTIEYREPDGKEGSEMIEVPERNEDMAQEAFEDKYPERMVIGIR